jgi:hypothetical protein
MSEQMDEAAHGGPREGAGAPLRCFVPGLSRACRGSACPPAWGLDTAARKRVEGPRVRGSRAPGAAVVGGARRATVQWRRRACIEAASPGEARLRHQVSGRVDRALGESLQEPPSQLPPHAA